MIRTEVDRSLVDAARRMDGDALVEIFDLFAPALYRYAFRLCRDALMADHIVGDVFAKLMEHLSAGKGPSTNLRSYLYEIAYHLVLDEAEYSHRAAPIEVVDFIQYDAYPTYVRVENRILFESVLQAMQNRLTDYQRHVLILRLLEGFSVKETAAIVGKKAGAVKVAQTRALAILREALVHPVVEANTFPGE